MLWWFFQHSVCSKTIFRSAFHWNTSKYSSYTFTFETSLLIPIDNHWHNWTMSWKGLVLNLKFTFLSPIAACQTPLPIALLAVLAKSYRNCYLDRLSDCTFKRALCWFCWGSPWGTCCSSIYQAVLYWYIPTELPSHSMLTLDLLNIIFQKGMCFLWMSWETNFSGTPSFLVFLKLKFSHTLKVAFLFS